MFINTCILWMIFINSIYIIDNLKKKINKLLTFAYVISYIISRVNISTFQDDIFQDGGIISRQWWHL